MLLTGYLNSRATDKFDILPTDCILSNGNHFFALLIEKLEKIWSIPLLSFVTFEKPF